MPSGPVNPTSDNTRLPDGGEVSLAQIAASGIAITWYEAIAIVQQICHALIEQPRLPALDSDSVFVQSSGEITIQSSGSGDLDTSVQSLGEMLRIWLADTPCPMPLRLVVAQATCTPPFFESVAELYEALSHLERSNRHEVVRAIYEQWRNAQPAASNVASGENRQTRYELVARRMSAIGEFARSTGGALLRDVRARWSSRRARSVEPVSDAAVQETSPDGYVPDHDHAAQLAGFPASCAARVSAGVVERAGCFHGRRHAVDRDR